MSDRVDTPQGFDLAKLFRLIQEYLGTDRLSWDIRRSQGYGLVINRLDGQLDTEEFVRLSNDEVEALLPGVEEWFYWFDAFAEDRSARFGLFDSDYMFVEGPRSLWHAIADNFEETTEIEYPTPGTVGGDIIDREGRERPSDNFSPPTAST